MANYQDFSDILAYGTFQDQQDIPKQATLSFIDQIVQSKLDFTNGDIFKKPDQKQESSKDSKNKGEFDYQEFCPKIKSENFVDLPTQNLLQNPSSRGQSPSQTTNSRKNSKKCENGSIKNIIGNITKKSMDIMLNSKRHINYVKMKCKRLQINYKNFEKYFSQIMNKIYGPRSIVELFEVNKDNAEEAKMKEVFEKVFMRIVRKRYPIYLLKLGKMKDSNEYIEIKNKRLLYFPDQIQNVMKMSGV